MDQPISAAHIRAARRVDDARTLSGYTHGLLAYSLTLLMMGGAYTAVEAAGAVGSLVGTCGGSTTASETARRVTSKASAALTYVLLTLSGALGGTLDFAVHAACSALGCSLGAAFGLMRGAAAFYCGAQKVTPYTPYQRLQGQDYPARSAFIQPSVARTGRFWQTIQQLSDDVRYVPVLMGLLPNSESLTALTKELSAVKTFSEAEQFNLTLDNMRPVASANFDHGTGLLESLQRAGQYRQLISLVEGAKLAVQTLWQEHGASLRLQPDRMEVARIFELSNEILAALMSPQIVRLANAMRVQNPAIYAEWTDIRDQAERLLQASIRAQQSTEGLRSDASESSSPRQPVNSVLLDETLLNGATAIADSPDRNKDKLRMTPANINTARQSSTGRQQPISQSRRANAPAADNNYSPNVTWQGRLEYGIAASPDDPHHLIGLKSLVNPVTTPNQPVPSAMARGNSAGISFRSLANPIRHACFYLYPPARANNLAARLDIVHENVKGFRQKYQNFGTLPPDAWYRAHQSYWRQNEAALAKLRTKLEALRNLSADCYEQVSPKANRLHERIGQWQLETIAKFLGRDHYAAERNRLSKSLDQESPESMQALYKEGARLAAAYHDIQATLDNSDAWFSKHAQPMAERSRLQTLADARLTEVAEDCAKGNIHRLALAAENILADLEVIENRATHRASITSDDETRLMHLHRAFRDGELGSDSLFSPRLEDAFERASIAVAAGSMIQALIALEDNMQDAPAASAQLENIASAFMQSKLWHSQYHDTIRAHLHTASNALRVAP